MFCREFAQEKSRRDLDRRFVENNLSVALANLFGDSGGAVPFRLLDCRAAPGAGLSLLLSCPDHLSARLRAAFTLQGSYQGKDCAYHVVGEGRTLLELVK